MPVVRILTLGCRLNQIESEAAANLFLDNSFIVNMDGVTAASPSDPSTLLVIINTCAVTQKAEQKARRLIRLVLKKFNKALILVTGCYAQLARVEIEKIDKRVLVLAGQLKSRIQKIPELLQLFARQECELDAFKESLKKEVINLPVLKADFPEDSFKLSASDMLVHSRASLKIQDGCNNSCAYCTIHIARGHSVSLDVKDCLERVLAFEKNGFDEVVLTSVNIAQYKGQFTDEKGQTQYFNFSRLLQYLLLNTSKINFRISSIYPQVVDDFFCRVISSDRVRPHFHISVQSGSNKILALMNRGYQREAVMEACRKLRLAKEGAFIACDIITGFPGESDSDFGETLDLCRKCNFTWIHAFPFSERPGTPACTMKPKIPQSLSGERAQKLTELAVKNKVEYIRAFAEKEMTAVVEKMSSNLADGTYLYNCMTENFIHCQLKAKVQLKARQAVRVKILEPLTERIKKGGEIEALAELAPSL